MSNTRKLGDYSQGFFVLFAYGLSLLSFVWLYVHFSDSSSVYKIMVVNAEVIGTIANIIGVDTIVRENVVMTGPVSLEIVPECTSLPYLAIFSAGIVAFPTLLRQKLSGIVLGVVGLSLLNIVRMVCLLLVAMFAPSAFDSAHVLVGQSLMIVASVFLWIIWWKRIRINDGTKP